MFGGVHFLSPCRSRTKCFVSSCWVSCDLIDSTEIFWSVVGLSQQPNYKMLPHKNEGKRMIQKGDFFLVALVVRLHDFIFLCHIIFLRLLWMHMLEDIGFV